MKKGLKWLGIVLLLLTAGCTAGYLVLDKSLPKGTTGEAADALAHKMLSRLNAEGWQQTQWVSWNFSNRHQFIWDKYRQLVEVRWKKNKVLLNLTNPTQSKALVNDREIGEDDSQRLIELALKYFNNDSFWLIAPFKVFDQGTTRSVVVQKDGSESLLVNYSQGGTTPGDTYLWHLNAEGIPLSYRMWVSIIPIGGLEATWGDWYTLPEGALISTRHRLGGFMDVQIIDLQSGESFSDLGLPNDPFEKLDL